MKPSFSTHHALLALMLGSGLLLTACGGGDDPLPQLAAAAKQ